MNVVLEIAHNVIDLEIESIKRMRASVNEGFVAATDILAAASGRIVVIGMGKSGIIGRKIAATLSSTGTSSFFVHPAEAYHGDLGMIHRDDVALMISNSGETEELIRLLPFMKHQGNRIVAMTGRIDSILGRNADAILDISVLREACTHNLAPTCSTTAALVMGDALAVVLSTLKNFQPADFALFHPGGSLGRRLLTRVADVMHKKNLPVCTPDALMREVVGVMTRGKLGLAIVMSEGRMLGIVTDGDLRRGFEEAADPLNLRASELMTERPYTISADQSLVEAEKLLIELAKRVLIVVDSDHRPVGVLQIFDVDG